MARHEGAQKYVYGILKKSPGIPIHYNDVPNSEGWNSSAVLSALARMHDNPAYPVYRVGKGTYVFRPNAEYPTAAYPPEVTPKKSVKEMDVVSPYPNELTKVKTNTAYGKGVTAEIFEYIGTIGDKILIRNSADEMFVAFPLSQFVD